MIQRNARRLVMAMLAAVTVGTGAQAQQERPAKRIANIVSVAVEEYSKAIDAQGRLISDIEYEEAVTFLADAREAAARLSGDRADEARALLDSLAVGVAAKDPPSDLNGLHTRFSQALGADAALDMPTRPVDLALGRALYARSCAACHGETAMGDGPQAATMQPPPPALGSGAIMGDVSPALMYRIVAVGVAGTPMVAWANTLTPDERWSIVAWLNSIRAPSPAAPGEGLFLQRCSGCHGTSGAGDGTLAVALSKLPVDLASFAWQAERSDSQIVSAIRDGVAGTSMPANRELASEEIAQLVAHVRRLSLGDVPVGPSQDTGDGQEASTRVIRLLDDALASARAGRESEAADQAFDAYIAFEPLETPGRARKPGRIAAMERLFADFRASIRSNDLRSAERHRDAIALGMPEIVELIRPTNGFWGSFLQSFLIIFREGLEAILVIGAVVTFLLKTGNRKRLRSIWIGVGAALAASAATAFILSTVLRALPATREIIEGVTMLIAVAVLFSVSYWLISKVEAARWQQFVREKVNNALQHGGGKALAFVAFLAVYREGAETALFYQALLREGAGLPISLGMVVGFALLAVIFVLFHRYGVRIPLRPFFAATSGLLYYMAFVFMGKGIRELQDGGVISITALTGWPQFEKLGIYPYVETLSAQALLLVLFVFALLRTFWPKRSVALPTVEPGPGEPSGEVVTRLANLEHKLSDIQRALDSATPTSGSAAESRTGSAEARKG